MARPRRAKQARGHSRVGEVFEARVGPVAHGGHCVVRLADEGNRVVFTRHGLPGELVRVRITDGTDGDRLWRGDVIEVLEASPDRVPAPCRFAGADRCGGCDFQHVSLARQRELKADVVREQLTRLARLTPDHPLLTGLTVEAVAGDHHGLGWRTRQRYVDLGVDAEGRQRCGMRKHRSHQTVEIDECLIEAEQDASHQVRGVAFDVAPGGFWQVHPGAPEALVTAVLESLDPQPGEKVLDLYAGVGLFARFLADRVGDFGLVAAVEGDRDATRCARRNLPGSRVIAGDVARVLADQLDEPFDLVVLDPPRQGAKRAVVHAIADRTPRRVAYVACDPAALARDVAFFAEVGYELTALRAFDLFPMTHHVECVAELTRSHVS